MINQPIYCITSDIDWASPLCTEDLLSLLQSLGVTPTLFASHDCPIVKAFSESHPDDVGVLPDFQSNSTSGKDRLSAIDHICNLYPNAKTFRSHSFSDSPDVLQEMSRRGLKYDSNLCLYLQPDIVPLQLGVPGITRFPVFWEDSSHWLHAGNNWDLRNFLAAFTSPGLKIINVHPFIISANIPSGDHYSGVKKRSTTPSLEDLNALRYDGPGARTFLIELIKFVKSQNMRFYTLNELYHLFPIKSFLVSEGETDGRNTTHTADDYEKYWQMSDADKQHFLKRSYQQRNATDIYATSRDFHARELEIQAISQSLSKRGAILDLGCGNGYTLISLAKRLTDWTMVGVDFAENLIEGARLLIDKETPGLQSHPEFICADAIDYLGGLTDDSLEYVITERFIQNLPSAEMQKKAIQQIYRILKEGGRFLMCEGSEDGFNRLNELREQVGLSIIPATSADNVSAIRIIDDEFEEYVQSEIGFKILQKLGMSNYMILSRVLHPLMVQPLQPRFDSRYNAYAKLIQEKTEFTPGYGSNVLWILEKPLSVRQGN